MFDEDRVSLCLGLVLGVDKINGNVPENYITIKHRADTTRKIDNLSLLTVENLSCMGLYHATQFNVFKCIQCV